MDWLIIYDTDVHGGISGLIAIKSLEESNEKILRHYSHFERVQKGQSPTLPITNPAFLAQALGNIAAPGKSNLMILDIPVNIMAPLDFINTLTNYRVLDKRVLFIDHHQAGEEYVRELFRRGVETIITGNSYDMSLVVPRIFSITSSTFRELEEWALIGALSDFDTTIADKITSEMETLVLEYLDSWWKNNWERDIELDPTLGSVGSIIQFIINRNFSAKEFLEWVSERGNEINVPENKVIGEVTYITGQSSPGLAWKTCWKANMLNGTKIAVSFAETPRGLAIIVAAYWRNPEIFNIIDKVISDVSAGRSVVGHSGARSILVSNRDEGERLVREIITRLNESISTRFYTPKTINLINESRVAKALHEDFKTILATIKEILRNQQEMYREYLELKKKQVELLERTDRHRYD